MGQSELGIRVRIDAAQGKAEINDLSQAIVDLNKQMKEAQKWYSKLLSISAYYFISILPEHGPGNQKENFKHGCFFHATFLLNQ